MVDITSKREQYAWQVQCTIRDKNDPLIKSQGAGAWKIRSESRWMRYIFQAMYPDVCFFSIIPLCDLCDSCCVALLVTSI